MSNHQTVLYIDTRERDVAALAEHMDAVAAEKEDLTKSVGRVGYSYEKRQITTGDFAIVRRVDNQEFILASIERKELKDYAASLRDGRYENIHKQLSLREKYGTQVFLLIEGPLFPSPNRRFDRWPFRVLESSFTDLMIEHQIQVMFTPDATRSASRMLDLQRAYSKLEDISRWKPVELGDVSVGGSTGGSSNKTQNTPAENVLTAVHAKSPLEDLLTMWSALPKISRVLGSALTQLSVEELLEGTQLERSRRILKLRTPLGKQFPVGARRTLESLGVNHEMQIKLLAGVPGISKSVAQHLLDPTVGRGTIQLLLAQNPVNALPHTLDDQNENDENEVVKGKKKKKTKKDEPQCALAMVLIPHGGAMRPLGQLKAGRILEILRRTCETSSPSEPGPSGAPPPAAVDKSADGPAGT